MSRKNQKQIWADKKLVAKLKRIQAKRMLNGEDVSIPDLTRDLAECTTFEDVERELVKMKKKKRGLRYDGGFF